MAIVADAVMLQAGPRLATVRRDRWNRLRGWLGALCGARSAQASSGLRRRVAKAIPAGGRGLRASACQGIEVRVRSWHRSLFGWRADRRAAREDLHDDHGGAAVPANEAGLDIGDVESAPAASAIGGVEFG